MVLLINLSNNQGRNKTILHKFFSEDGGGNAAQLTLQGPYNPNKTLTKIFLQRKL